MGKHTSVGKRERIAHRERASVESWPEDDIVAHAIDDPDVGVDACEMRRWRRNRSEPPPPLGITGSGLAQFRRPHRLV
jgi:hypothetical protein